jgi:hypothetical protein
MEPGQDYRRIFYRLAEASQAQQKRWLKFRETWDTMILGTLSTSVGVVVLIFAFQGAFGIRSGEWHELWPGAPVPSPRLAIASVVGEVLGVAGLALGKIRGDVISPLSAVGTIVCLIQIYLFLGQFIIMHFF